MKNQNQKKKNHIYVKLHNLLVFSFKLKIKMVKESLDYVEPVGQLNQHLFLFFSVITTVLQQKYQ